MSCVCWKTNNIVVNENLENDEYVVTDGCMLYSLPRWLLLCSLYGWFFCEWRVVQLWPSDNRPMNVFCVSVFQNNIQRSGKKNAIFGFLFPQVMQKHSLGEVEKYSIVWLLTFLETFLLKLSKSFGVRRRSVVFWDTVFSRSFKIKQKITKSRPIKCACLACIIWPVFPANTIRYGRLTCAQKLTRWPA